MSICEYVYIQRLAIAEDAGIDVSKDVSKNRKDIDEGRTY